MKRITFVLGTLLMISMLLAACGAEQTSTAVPNTDVPPITAESTMTEDGAAIGTPNGTAGAGTTTPGVPVTGEDSTTRVTNLLDYDVWNQSGEQLGEVEDMVLDLDNSRVSYVVIETGGFLDLGDKTLLIPWGSLELQTPVAGEDENGFVITIDQETLDKAPDMDLESVLPGNGQPGADWDADVRNFWESGVLPSATEATGDATAVPEMTATTTTGSATDTGTGSELVKLQGVMLASDVLGMTISFSPGTGTGTDTVEPTVEATVDATTNAQPTATADAGSGTGTGTGTGTAPTEATVEDIIINPDSGDILYLVLSAAFDDGDRWIPVPLSVMNWDMTHESFVLGADGNVLLDAPFFQPDEFPDTSADGWDIDFEDFWQTVG